MDIFATTEDDWMPTTNKSNHNEGIIQFSPCSSPLLFGRKLCRQPQEYDQQEEQMFEMSLDGPNQFGDYQFHLDNENNELENLLKQLPTPKIRRKIRKPKSNKKSSPLSLLVKEVVKDKENRKNIFNQIQKCQKAKLFIDQLEGMLVQLKSQLISTMKAQD